MPSVEIDGGDVVYDILGDTGDLVVMTPGGRFGMDIPGLRPLADAVAAGGYRVLLWDRPNCGASHVRFTGQSESHMRAETLHGLLTALGTGPVTLAGGSGGARDSMLTAIRYPDLVSKLVLWNIVGGIYGTINLAAHYVLPNLQVARRSGMAGVARMPEWRALIERNPGNEQRLLEMDRDEFVRLMSRWLDAYVPKPGQTIPGVADTEFERITVPTLIIRGGAHDPDHPRRTSLEVSCLIEGSTLIDPPWPEDAWERAIEDRAHGRVDRFNLFDTWVLAAPAILAFLDGRAV